MDSGHTYERMKEKKLSYALSPACGSLDYATKKQAYKSGLVGPGLRPAISLFVLSKRLRALCLVLTKAEAEKGQLWRSLRFSYLAAPERIH